MSLDVGIESATGYPQTTANRTRSSLVSELCEYIGGESNSDDQGRAANCLDEAVRHYNKYCWRFNRMNETVTLVASTSTYTLTATNVKAPWRAVVLDASSLDVQKVRYIPYHMILDVFQTASATSSIPEFYTLRNLHEAGQITYYPGLGATLTYPSVRHEYFRRIALEAGSDDVLEVPVEVEQAIFEWALWRLMLKTNPKDAAPFGASAKEEFAQVLVEWRDWPDIPSIGVRG